MENQSVLATDFKQVDIEMRRWKHQREMKSNIWRAFQDYIMCLENDLIYETDLYKRSIIEKEIKKLKKEQTKYYVPSILEGARLDKMSTTSENKRALERSSFSLVKKSSRIRKEK